VKGSLFGYLYPWLFQHRSSRWAETLGPDIQRTVGGRLMAPSGWPRADGQGRTAPGRRPTADSQRPSHLLKFSPLRGSKFFSTKKLPSVPLKNHLPLSFTGAFLFPAESSHLRLKSYSRDFSSLIILATWKSLVITNYSSCYRFSITFSCTSEAKKVLNPYNSF
jgi:hypothetical protein